MRLVMDIQKELPLFRLNVSISTEQKILGILGASGAGKTMTLRCLAGLEAPTKGHIHLNHQVLFDAERKINLPSRKRRVGYLSQSYALFPHLTIAQNIAFGLHNMPFSEKKERVQTYLNQIQLTGFENRYPSGLSGGQQQRVALARALAPQPNILLLDEPFAALDDHLRSQMEKYLLEMLSTFEGITLFVTHNVEEGYRICDELFIFSKGAITASGPKETLFTKPPTYTAAQLTGCKNFSQVKRVDAHHVKAMDWGCELEVESSELSSPDFIGIRAHHLDFPNEITNDNTFPCWISQLREGPHRLSIYLKLFEPPQSASDYHLQAEVFKETWPTLKEKPFPWYVHLSPQQLFLMKADSLHA